MRYPLAVILLGILSIMLSAFWSGGQSAAQKGGGPPIGVELDGYWVDNPENVRIQSGLGGGPYFDAWVQFTPADWGLARDADVDDGAIVGNSWVSGNIGVEFGDNAPCNFQTNINLEWLEATTDTTNFFTYNPPIEAIYTSNWPGYDIMDSGLERAVEEYPDFLNDMFLGIAPRARYYAHVTTDGGELAVQYLIFGLGFTLPGLPPFDAEDGYPALIIEGDPTAPPEPGRTWDICTPWDREDNFWAYSEDNPDTDADEGGVAVRTNPTGWGWYSFNTFVRFRPDADGDGIENQLDTCPYDPNWDEPPQYGSGPDGDGLDSVCDPFWDVTNDDEDDDGYANRQDNCPLDANGLNQDNQLDGDGDGIGFACDLDDGSVDGPVEEAWWEFWVEVTGDSDLDGWSDAFENIVGSWPWDPLSTPEHLRADPGACSDGVDNDLDGLVDGYDPGCDVDGDGIVNAFDACPDIPEDWDGFQDADGCPDNDNDMDGIWDWEEGWTDFGVWCGNIPEDFDAYQDWDGCPDPDNDFDGFPDVTDDCPGTDWTAGPDGEADTGDEPLINGVPIQTREDYDGVLDTDGCHDSPGDDYDGDGLTDEDEVFIHGTDPTNPDTDADGVLDGPDNCPAWPNPDQNTPPWAIPFGDADCDGWTMADENFIGTDATAACGVLAWPPDFNDSNRVDIFDVNLFKPAFFSSAPGPPYQTRLDLKPDSKIDIFDVNRLKPFFFVSCTP